jgi:multiple sugar transport system permease protein
MATLTASARPARRMPRPRTIAIVGGAYLIGLVFLLPYLEMVLTALRPDNQIKDRDLFPTSISFKSFTSIWSTGFGSSLGSSLEIAAGSTVLVLLVAIPAAYYTARRKFRGRGIFLLLVLVTQMFQPTAMILGIYQEFQRFGMYNSIWALILVNAGFNMAFAIWIMNAYFSSIPQEIEEAAIMDGCTRLGAMFRVMLPLAAPGIVTALIFTFIAAWNEFVVALTLTDGKTLNPLTLKLSEYVGQYNVDWEHLFAGAVISTIPVIVLFALIENKVASGLTAGSVK